MIGRLTLKTLPLWQPVAGVLIVGSISLYVATQFAMRDFPDNLQDHIVNTKKNTYFDRHGKRLNVTFENDWNSHDVTSIHDVPDFLQHALITSEDKRFFKHKGIDWLARVNAVKQNIVAGEVKRGASTITEQVVRMLHPRPRTFWSRWVEGFEAQRLERQYSKLDILEFYINQVPYRAKRRGVVQAANYYFNRDLSTLSHKEMLTLAVLVRSPKWLDPSAYVKRLNWAIQNLQTRLDLSLDENNAIKLQEIVLATPKERIDLSHFIRFSESQQRTSLNNGYMYSTIDLELQTKAQSILDNRLERLAADNVTNGAMLVVNHETNEILAWAIGYAGKENKPYNQINAVTVKRQPGSTLKPLLYASALNAGWTAATMIDDAPLDENVGLGMHTYHNYSRDHYGLISLRESLGNSLNIPAIKAIQLVGPGNFLNFLNTLGIDSLAGHPNVYGDGLALGNGEIKLYELVQAYTVLARMGDFKPLSFSQGEAQTHRAQRVISEDIASLIADIMSDPIAREKEFGLDSILNLPYQTAVKTGTSSDYRDAWAVGFNDKYTVGIWMGNLDYTEMNEVTGASGPALVLRSIFNELNRFRQVRPLYFSHNLTRYRVCINTGLRTDGNCEARDEWFIPDTQPNGIAATDTKLRIRKPSKGLMLAMDPRIPDEHEFFEFALSQKNGIKRVDWYINDQLASSTKTTTFNWKLKKGKFTTHAAIHLHDTHTPLMTEKVHYQVQ